MLELASSEVALVLIARSLFMGGFPNLSKKNYPPKIGPSAATVLKDTLSKQVMNWLTKDGYEKRIFLKNGSSNRSRIWERHEPSLKFSSKTFEILDSLRKSESLPEISGNLEIGDQIILVLSPNSISWRKDSPLCWLLQAEELLSFGLEVPPNLSFDSLIQNESWAIEFLTSRIIKYWVRLEKSKNLCQDLDKIVRLGNTQDIIMTKFLESCEKHNRKDLSVIFTDTASEIMNLRTRQYPSAEFWKEGFSKLSGLSLSQRQNASKASGTLLRNISIIQKWYKEAGIVPHWEPEYQTAQACLSIWKPLTTRPSDIKDSMNGFERAAKLYKDLVEI